MSENKPKKKKNVLIRQVLFPTEYGLFIAANLLDLFLTMVFIRYGAGEANPFARWVILNAGKTAFAAYKLVLMLFVIGLCELVGRRRKGLARLLIWFGIVVTALVALSSGWRFYLYVQTGI